MTSSVIQAPVRGRFDRCWQLEHRRHEPRLHQQGRSDRDERIGKDGAIVIRGVYRGRVGWDRGMAMARPVRMDGDTAVMRSPIVIRAHVNQRCTEGCPWNGDRERNRDSLPHYRHCS